MDIEIKFQWKINFPLHVGTGISRINRADRLIKMKNGFPYIPGEAVKGAIRGNAERIAAWFFSKSKPQPLSTHPVIERIFSPKDDSTYYKFHPADCAGGATASKTVSFTAIDSDSGIALDESLRTIEALCRNSIFKVRVSCLSGSWDQNQSRDWEDLRFLLAAILATDAVAGRKGIGFGRVQCIFDDKEICGILISDFAKEEIVHLIRNHMISSIQESL
ncbi:MAG: hypothetical protein A2161_03250 [Candidatus Schekmanbacteria bacterium RBG_13_48_7]|uniref:CRISPR type III-associated protein domain-containing protein n=1 Tax=Candidatus Schekmanbacteria bacterium RBG_13_48_7 TaxID=1817878 RepID=A0A1F7RW02_9BACT|nr:MAG: hypothetical protein A2161_03250 [Candidatus Schekmanbacteria bacterium RBG_13_48_7]